MPPKLVSDDGKHIVIRPLAYCTENDMERYAQAKQFPIIPCNLCGSQENLQRQAMKAMIAEWSKKKGWVENMARAMGTVVPSHLMDAELFDFKNLTVNTYVREGDIAFDEEPCATLSDVNETTELTEQVIRFTP